MIKEKFLRNVCHANAQSEILNKLIIAFNKYLPIYEINNKKRICYFISQCAHETGGFIFFKELGGQEYCSKYEPETKIGHSLGNIKKGDGYKYKGRGIIQLSGRANYDLFGNLIGKDLINFPDLLLDMDSGTHVACEYWKRQKLNNLSDHDNIIDITKRINGGLNGLKNRELFFNILIKRYDVENI